MPALRTGAPSIVSLAFVAGCASGGTSLPLPAANVPAIGTPQKKAPSSGVRVTIAIPRNATGRRRRPAFTSPATASMKLIVSKGGKTVVTKIVELGPRANNCTVSTYTTNCVASVPLAAGSYTASVTTYDRAKATGNVLSVGYNVSFAVAANAFSTLPLTLAGVPKGIKVYADGTNEYYAVAVDADGNFITGAGAPTFTATRTSGKAVAAIDGPTAQQPNTITLSEPKTPLVGPETIGLTASYPAKATNGCKLAGAVCSVSSAIVAAYGQQLLAANYGLSSIDAYLLPISSTSMPTYTLPAPSVFPMALAPNGRLFATSYGDPGMLFEWDAPYTQTPNVANRRGVNDPSAILFDASNDVFVVNESNPGSVSEYKPPYTGTPVSITGSLNDPYAAVLDTSNNLYVGDSTGHVEAFAKPYTGAPAATFKTTSDPYAMAVAGNKLFVGEGGSSGTLIEVFKLPVTSASTPALTITAGATDPVDLLFDSSGNLFVANGASGPSGGTIAEYKPPFTNDQIPAATLALSETPPASYSPYDLAFDSSGDLFVANYYGGAFIGGIDEYAPPFKDDSLPKVSLATSAFDYSYYIAITKASFSSGLAP